MKRATKLFMGLVPAIAILALFLLPVIPMNEEFSTCGPPPSQGCTFDLQPSSVSPMYAYFSIGAVYVTNAQGTTHSYCWMQGGEPGASSAAAACGVVVNWQ